MGMQQRKWTCTMDIVTGMYHGQRREICMDMDMHYEPENTPWICRIDMDILLGIRFA
jgi:hypothetical protein